VAAPRCRIGELVMPKESDNPMQFGTVLLIGHELFRICGSQPVDGFFDYVLEKWKTFFIKEYKSEQGTS
jgi:hypothetical protein